MWFALFCELSRHHHLRSDASVIGSRQPQHAVAVHSAPPRQHVLQRVIQRVSHVQKTCHIGRRNHHREGRRVRVGLGFGSEILIGFPFGIPAAFDFFRFVLFRNFHNDFG